jgi:hypothetical protein
LRLASSQVYSGTYKKLLEELTLVRSYGEHSPTLLFTFADGQTCSQLNAKRQRIGQSAGCSLDGSRCREGTPQQLT